MQRFSRAGQSPLVNLSGQVREQLCRSDLFKQGSAQVWGETLPPLASNDLLQQSLIRFVLGVIAA